MKRFSGSRTIMGTKKLTFVFTRRRSEMRRSHLSFVERATLCTLGCLNTRQNNASIRPIGSISPQSRDLGRHLSLTLYSQWPAVLSTSPNSVNRGASVNSESQRDFDVLSGVPGRKRAILDADLTGRDEQLGAAVNKKPQKTRDLNEKSRDSRLGFLCLPDWLSFEPILKGSSGRTRSRFHLVAPGF